MGAGRATLRWNPNTEPDLAAYRIYWKLLPGGYNLAVSLPVNALADASNPGYTLADFPADGTWYFVVTAVDSTGNESESSQEISKVIVRPAVRLARAIG